MPVRLAVPAETRPGESRVALDPTSVKRFAKLGVTVAVQAGAGRGSAHRDGMYDDAEIVPDAATLLRDADVVVKVNPPSLEEIDAMKEGAVLIATILPHMNPGVTERLRDRTITAFAMELIPRISRAQSMDILSSQATVAGYEGVLIGANRASGFFPMLTTAAGTLRPATVLIIGAGVAGLQAIATAKRLGAVVTAYDIRAATREQVESLGAKMIDTGVDAEGEGGYARELTESEKEKQADALAAAIAKTNVVVSTASVPGRPAPKIISRAMVESMKPGSVIVDLAAESGGNCVLTEPGSAIVHEEVIVDGPLNLPSRLPFHATEMYAKNIYNFLSPMLQEGEFAPDWDDEVVAGSLLTHAGEIKHESAIELVGGAS
jgi:NAD(P) transhydrogenase subunit alpha